jgi:hypothetical protein
MLRQEPELDTGSVAMVGCQMAGMVLTDLVSKMLVRGGSVRASPVTASIRPDPL